MTAENFLNLNIDLLFEQHSIAEIETIQRKVQNEAENKRDELRTMVGERYRDLIQAADTIVAMKASAGTLIAQLNALTDNCRTMHERQVIGFQTDAAQLDQNNVGLSGKKRQQQQAYSTAVQIKLLTMLPEQIWAHIDREEFHTATQLYIFARYISTGLHLDTNNALIKRLPVARHLWDVLLPFNATIREHITLAFERKQLSAEALTDCLLSLLLLDGPEFTCILNKFLDIRAQTYEKCLDFQATAAGRVKERIMASLELLNGTVELLDSCLKDDGLFYQELKRFQSVDARTCIEFMIIDDSHITSLLPDIITGYRPKYEMPQLEQTVLKSALTTWLCKITHLANTKLKQLFELVQNIQTIQELKLAARTLKCQFNLSAAIDDEAPQQLNFYELHYLPLLSSRVHDIIEENLALAVKELLTSLLDTLKCVNSKEQRIRNADIWRELPNDLPPSLAIALSADLNNKKLLNRMRGYDANIIRICAKFNAQLKSIINEMDVLLQEQNTPADYKLALIQFLRDSTQRQLTDFISQVKSLRLQERQALLFTVRCCTAIIELCPQLQVCFSQQSSWRQWVSNVTADSVQHWQRFCALLVDELFQLWVLIAEDILRENQLPAVETMTTDMLLKDFVHWQTITLEQSSEAGGEDDDAASPKTQMSSIRIPNQPCIWLQVYLFTIVRALQRCVPQTLPTKVLQAFTNQLLRKILSHYEDLACNESIRASQNVCLQLYFDLRFLQGIFALARDERVLFEQFNAIQNKLCDCIDPFDLEIFSEYLTENTKRSVIRLCGQFGVLAATTATMKSSETTQALQASLAHETDPNVLTLSVSGSSSLWFPLLPVIVPQTQVAEINSNKLDADKKPPETPTRKIANTRKTDTSKAKSTAASFFGMSQDWFR